jgi:subtilisin family serine protease
MPDDDPLDFLGHGTHVTGIIAGKSDNFTGVAPEATIYAYKVFGTEVSSFASP